MIGVDSDAVRLAQNSLSMNSATRSNCCKRAVTARLRQSPNTWLRMAFSVQGLVGLVAVGLLAYSYADWMKAVIESQTRGLDDGTVLLLPPIFMICCWVGWKRTGTPFRRRVPFRCVVRGVLLIGLGQLIHLEASLLHFQVLTTVALVLTLRGLLWIAGGRRAIRAYSLATVMVLFAAPVPMAWRQWTSLHLQSLVSVVSSTLLSVAGTPVFREGNLLYLPGQILEIAEGCSGIRQLTAFVALTTLLSGLYRLGMRSSLLLVLSSPLFAIAANCFRVLITAALLLLVGNDVAEGAFHTLEGTMLVLVSSTAIVAVANWLRFVEDKKSRVSMGAV